MMQDTTGKNLVDFWSWAAEKGLMNKNTASSLRSACSKVLEVDDDWESMDVSSVDVEELLTRFVNLRKQDYKPSTLETYKRRFANALEMYLEHARDPAGWKPPTSQTRRTTRRSGDNPSDSKTASGDRPGVAKSPPGSDLIEYPFPLHGNRTARLWLPRDLSEADVKRLSAFVGALAIEEEEASG